MTAPWPPPTAGTMVAHAVARRPWMLSHEAPRLPWRMRAHGPRVTALIAAARRLASAPPPSSRSAEGRPTSGMQAAAPSPGTSRTAGTAVGSRRPDGAPDACRGVGRHPTDGACPWCHRPAQLDHRGRVASHQRPTTTVVNILSPTVGRQG